IPALHLASRPPACRGCKPMARAPNWSPASVLAIALTVTVLSCGTCPPLPSVTSLSPASATAGGSQFLLTVNGNDFHHDSVVSWNGSFRVTTFVSSHKLVVTITTTDIAQPETVLVSVFNPPEGGTTFVSGGIGVMSTATCSGKTSNAVSFTVSP
ncbi:MAG: IPT/TIG domain-containing protein, partial [Candidatus Sulfotelmatobacter sp.]